MNGNHNGRLKTPDSQTRLQTDWTTACAQFLSACIFTSPRFLDLAEGLEPAAFYGDWADVYTALITADADDVVSLRAVLDNLPSRPLYDHAYKQELAARLTAEDVMPLEGHVRRYIEQIKNAHRRARAFAAAERLAIAALDERSDMDAAETAVIDALLTSDATGDNLAWMSEIGAEVLADLEYNIANPAEVRGLQSGLVDLDRAVGGFDHSNYVIVGARPSMGKSALVFEMARGFAERGHPGLVITSETSRKMFFARLACSDVGVNYQNEFRRGQLFDNNERRKVASGYLPTWDILRASIERLMTLPIIHIPASRGPRSLFALAHRLKRAHGIEWLLVDTINLLPTDARGRGEYQDMTDKSQQLARIPHELGIMTLVTWQLSRAAEGAGTTTQLPAMHHLRDSGGGEQDGDIILALYRPEYYASRGKQPIRRIGSLEIDDNEMMVLVLKNRDGATGRSVILNFDLQYARVRNAARREVEGV
jgi:replicative DNA helicase